MDLAGHYAGAHPGVAAPPTDTAALTQTAVATSSQEVAVPGTTGISTGSAVATSSQEVAVPGTSGISTGSAVATPSQEVAVPGPSGIRTGSPPRARPRTRAAARDTERTGVPPPVPSRPRASAVPSRQPRVGDRRRLPQRGTGRMERRRSGLRRRVRVSNNF